MANNWLILDDGTTRGVPVNVDFLMKVLYAPSTKPLQITVYHGITGSATEKGSTQALKFASANLALAAYNRIIATLAQLGNIGKDLRTPAATITGVTPGTATAGVATAIKIVGTGFSSTGKITMITAAERAAGAAGNDRTITFVDANNISFTTDPASPGGPTTYSLEYTAPDGTAAESTGCLVLN